MRTREEVNRERSERKKYSNVNVINKMVRVCIGRNYKREAGREREGGREGIFLGQLSRE